LRLDIHTSEFRANPYPFFRELREYDPVHRLDALDCWLVTRYADVQAVLEDSARFSSQGIGTDPEYGPDSVLHGRSLVGMDPPRHTCLRGLTIRSLSPRLVKQFENRTRLLARELISKIQNKTHIDFIADYAVPLPMLPLFEVLGIDLSSNSFLQWKEWIQMLLTWRRQGRELYAREQAQIIFENLCHLMELRKKDPRDDVISYLVRNVVPSHSVIPSEVEGSPACKKVTTEDCFGIVRLLLVAGTEASTNLMGNALLALLNHRHCIEVLKKDPLLIPKFVEEVMRFDGPVVGVLRRATMDLELCGRKIRSGDLVIPLFASANHDESVFPQSGCLDLYRSQEQKHLAFGAGIHYCPGTFFARTQTRIAIEEWLSAFSNFNRDETQKLEYLDSFLFRGLKSLELKI